VRSIPAVFTNIGNRSLAAVVLDATDRVLGDDHNSWRILAELANGTSFSINEVVDLVEFSH
jgi:hypothetical protein